MNRWSLLAVVAMAVAMPAAAQGRWGDWERERGRDRGFREQPVRIEKRKMEWKLARIDARLAEIMSKVSPRERRMLRDLNDLRDELTDVRELLTGAEVLGPPSLPQPPAVRPGPPPPVHAPPGYQQPPPPAFQPAVQPMPEPAFRNLLGAMSRESFANDKLRVLEQAAPSNWFVVAQVQQILSQFSFPVDRLKAMRVLKPRILDTNDYYQLYGAFEFPRDKDELKRILGQ